MTYFLKNVVSQQDGLAWQPEFSSRTQMKIEDNWLHKVVF